jgi:hypothetical protein
MLESEFLCFYSVPIGQRCDGAIKNSRLFPFKLFLEVFVYFIACLDKWWDITREKFQLLSPRSFPVHHT